MASVVVREYQDFGKETDVLRKAVKWSGFHFSYLVSESCEEAMGPRPGKVTVSTYNEHPVKESPNGAEVVYCGVVAAPRDLVKWAKSGVGLQNDVVASIQPLDANQQPLSDSAARNGGGIGIHHIKLEVNVKAKYEPKLQAVEDLQVARERLLPDDDFSEIVIREKTFSGYLYRATETISFHTIQNYKVLQDMCVSYVNINDWTCLCIFTVKITDQNVIKGLDTQSLVSPNHQAVKHKTDDANGPIFDFA